MFPMLSGGRWQLQGHAANLWILIYFSRNAGGCFLICIEVSYES